jgi:hypothetical protein
MGDRKGENRGENRGDGDVGTVQSKDWMTTFAPLPPLMSLVRSLSQPRSLSARDPPSSPSHHLKPPPTKGGGGKGGGEEIWRFQEEAESIGLVSCRRGNCSSFVLTANILLSLLLLQFSSQRLSDFTLRNNVLVHH